MDIKYIGFYKELPALYESHNYDTQWTETPIENSIKEPQEELIKLLDSIQNFIQKTNKESIKTYTGYSTCRICHKPNGYLEYNLGGYVWPSGYIHYLKNHNVEIDNDFKKYLLSLQSISHHF